MIDKIKAFLNEAEEFRADGAEALESFRIKYLGKKGVLNELFEDFKKAPAEQKREIGQLLNKLKNTASERIAQAREALEVAREKNAEKSDLGIVEKIRSTPQGLPEKINLILASPGIAIWDSPSSWA